jgi:hypothetical protein
MRYFRFVPLLLVAALPALGAVVLQQSIEEMTRASTLVVRGRVGQQQVSWDADHQRIETFTEIQVSELLKGSGKKTLVVRQPGGVIGRIGQSAAGAAKFEGGEEVILFLQPAADDPAVYLPLGLSAGKVLVSQATLGGPRALRRLSGLAFYDPSTKAPGPVRPLDVEDLGTVEAFSQRVRRAAGAAR